MTFPHIDKIRSASREELVELVEQIAETIFPEGDADHDCGSDEIGEVCNALHKAGFGPTVTP